MDRNWTVAHGGSQYTIEWGGRPWTIDFTQSHPGLAPVGVASATLLSLAGVADLGRIDSDAFTPATLIGVAHHLDRIEATYRPKNWGGMLIKGIWRPTGENGIDLVVHLQADSVDELHAVEVEVLSRFLDRSQSLSFEALGARPATTEAATSVLSPFEPRATTVLRLEPQGSSGHYLEFCNGHDLSGTTRESVGAGTEVRYALFGHALEKGVVIRGRLRGLWLNTSPGDTEVHERQQQFRAEPLPLGI